MPRSFIASRMVVLILLLGLAGCGGPSAPVTPGMPTGVAELPGLTPSQSVTASVFDPTHIPAVLDAPSESTAAPDAAAERSPATCGPPDAPASCLRLAYGADPDSLDPQQVSFVGEVAMVTMNYQPLLRFDPETLQPGPGAASRVDVTEDGRMLTFHLRPDQTYSDGAALTAANFEYAWKRLCDPMVAGDFTSIAFPIAGCETYVSAFDTGGLTVTDEARLAELRDAVGVTALDANTLEIRLREPAPYFLNVAALWLGAPVRQDLIEAGGPTWWAEPANYVGNGPFQLTEWELQSHMRWVKNPHYAVTEHAPRFEASEWSFHPQGEAAFLAYQQGELDLVGIRAEDLPVVNADSRLRAQRIDQGAQCTFRLDFNLKRPPFDNVKVRQAFAYALDREGFVRDVLQGLGQPAYSFIPPGQPGHDSAAASFRYDPARARQLLQEAGFDFSQVLNLSYGSSARAQLRFEYLAARLQTVLGVKIQLDPVEPTTFTSLFKDPATVPPLFILGWCTAYPDPQAWLSVVYRTGGVAAAQVGFSDAAYDTLIDQADRMPLDDPERLQIYQEAQRLLVDQLTPSAMFWYDAFPFLVQSWISGVQPTPLDPPFPGFQSLETITIRAGVAGN